MDERFNGRISGLVKQTCFTSAAELDVKLSQYMTTYNHHISQHASNHQSPIQARKRWKIENPEFFVKRVHENASLDSHHKRAEHEQPI